jgi:hypothetical protein
MAEKQLEATIAAAAFQKQWFAGLRRRVFDERQPYALLQADVPFELFDLVDIPDKRWEVYLCAQRRNGHGFE